eukprot:jgi/Tetstr1/435248/TSEL_024167.t1
MHEDCIRILKDHRYSQTHSARGEIHTSGCGAFPAFRTVGAKLGYKAQYSAAFRRAAPLLEEKGWNVTVVGSKPDAKDEAALADMDLIICDRSSLGKMRQIAPHARFILLAAHDSAALGSSSFLEDDSVLAFLQHTDFKDPADHNRPTLMGRRHTVWIQEGVAAVRKKNKAVKEQGTQLNAISLGKIIPMIPQIQRWRYPLDCGGHRGDFAHFARSGFHPSSDHSFAMELVTRPIDIAFAGNVHGKQREDLGVNAHRRQAIDTIRKIARKHKLYVVVHDSDIPFETYVSLLRHSKFFVSPFGIGEFSGKDYEALLAGAVLVKPKADHLTAYPNIYDSKYSIATTINFSDLEAKVMPLLKSAKGLAKAQRMVDSARDMLREYSTTEHFAGDVDKLLRTLVSQNPSGLGAQHRLADSHKTDKGI